jgi:Domain of unknown function (DUF4135)
MLSEKERVDPIFLLRAKEQRPMIQPGRTLQQLRAKYKTMNVEFEDDFTLMRAILYETYVERTYASLTAEAIKKELNQIPGGYGKVEPALSSSGLLTGLCSIMDTYIVPAVNHALTENQMQYGAYFQSVFEQYPNSSAFFLKKYLSTSQALAKINAHFQQNILTACQRVLGDWHHLQNIFVDQKGSSLDQLLDIQSTGSDFHKGGQQVLLLTFSTKPTGALLRVVYKPSDLEVDCLIMGNTQAVNALHASFQQASLMELLNSLTTAHPTLGLEPFPTYKILPISPGSSLQRDKDRRLPIRSSYGYLQFLDYTGMMNPSEEKEKMCRRFYTLLGQLTAVACAFSLTDLHLENVIVHSSLPYLIDLETSLIRPINRVAQTGMMDDPINGGAICGILRDSQMPYVSADNVGAIKMLETYHPQKNRLWKDGRTVISVKDYWEPMREGCRKTLQLIQQTAQKEKGFDAWFSRLKKGAVVRFLPAGSPVLARMVVEAFAPQQDAQPVSVVAQKEIDKELFYTYTDWFNAVTGKQAEDAWNLLPFFLCLQSEYVIDDIANGDVPVFYHQVTTGDVMDSSGRTLLIPDTVTIKNRKNESETKAVKALLKRETFFAEPPINVTEREQLAHLNEGKITAFLKELEAIITALQEQKAYELAMNEAAEAKKRAALEK